MQKIQFSLLIIVALFIASPTTAQNATNFDLTNNEYLSSKTVPIFTGADKYAGSPYATDDFERGKVFKNGKLVANNVGLRYNVKQEQIELKQDLNSSKIVANVVKPSEDIYVKIMNHLYIFIPSQSVDLKDGYYLVLHEGPKFDFYKKVLKEFIEGKKSMNSITRDIAPSYKDDEIYFVANKEGELIKLSNSRNKRLNVFPDSKKELKTYINDKKLNISKEADFVKLVSYYNSL